MGWRDAPTIQDAPAWKSAPAVEAGKVTDALSQDDGFQVGQMLKNVPSSAANLVGGIYQAVRHPVDTASALGEVFTGGIQNALPEWAQAGSAAPQREKASAVASFYKDRYGSGDGFLRALEKDPVGVLADASIVLGGGAAAASKVPALAKGMETAAAITNPITLGAKGIKAVGGATADLIGNLGTHTGGASIRTAYQAGKEGGSKGEAFTDALRGNAPLEGVVDQAKAALNQMRVERGQAYRAGMTGVSKDKTVLNFGPVDDAFNKQMSVGSYKGKVLDKSAAETKTKISEVLDEWRKADPAEFHTPEGFDALKQAIGDVRDSTQFGTPARRVADNVYQSVKGEIVKQAPGYAKVMKEYEVGSTALKEIEQALSIGKKASADTALRKLQSVLRSGVNTNYGKRLSLVQQLEKAGAPNLTASIAGQSLNNWAPRGLGTATAIPTAAGAGWLAGNPLAAIPALALQSPRLMGEAAYGTGLATRYLDALKQGLPLSNPEFSALLLSEAGQQSR